jgi:hypothetical protein
LSCRKAATRLAKQRTSDIGPSWHFHGCPVAYSFGNLSGNVARSCVGVVLELRMRDLFILALSLSLCCIHVSVAADSEPDEENELDQVVVTSTRIPALVKAESDSFGVLQTPPLDLGQVELIKGAASALYGASAVNGGAASAVPSDKPN